MNIHAQKLQHTPAEQALLEGFAQRAPHLPGDAATKGIRDAAMADFRLRGLPSRRIEAWHYTDLRRLMADVPGFEETATDLRPEPLIAGSSVLTVVNGTATDAASIDGVATARLADRLAAGDISAIAGDIAADNVIDRLNRGFVSDGWLISLAAGVQLDKPVELQLLHGGGQTHTRCGFTAGEGSRAVVIERQSGEGHALTTHVNRVEVAANAEVTWIVFQEQPEGATALSRFEGTIAESGKLSLFVMNAGGRLVRYEVKVAADGKASDFQLRGVNLLSGDSHTDITMVLSHVGYGTTSREIVRNVVRDKAQGVFQGQIRVDREAQKTDAKMACNTLLLSDDAGFSTKPELEIFADDVACGHGATVTEIEGTHLFYLMSRGIPEHKARALLVEAFLAEIIEELEDEALIEALESRLHAWFEQ